MFNIFKSKSVKEEKHVDDENKNHTKIVYIHGANQSSNCWNYIREKCDFQNEILINYSSYTPFYENLQNIVKKINEPVFLVGHSLGGIYALHLLEHCDVVGVVSISTPFRGSSAADWAKYIVPQYQLFKDVGRRAKPVVQSHSIVINKPWTQIITVRGKVPYLNGENDGVVTVASMRHRQQDMNCVNLDCNHYDVLVSQNTVDIITKAYNSVH